MPSCRNSRRRRNLAIFASDCGLIGMVVAHPEKVACPQLPGNYSVHCNNRQLRVFWIPPRDDTGNFVRAVPTFREMGSPRFTSFADQLRPPGEEGRHYDHNGTKPNTIYEFGLNHVTGEGVVSIPPLHNANQNTTAFPLCLCTSPPDLPAPPLNFNCHYLHENDYTCDWAPGNDHGSPLSSFRLQYMSYNASNIGSSEWLPLAKVPANVTKANVTLPIRTPTEVQLIAENGVGQSKHVSKLVKPPLYYHSGNHSKAADYFIYGAVGLGALLLLVLLVFFVVLKRRRDSLKGSKRAAPPFLINFARGRGNAGQIRLFNNGSLQDTSVAATKTTSLSGGGPPFELLTSSCCEPAWSQEVNSLYGPAASSCLDLTDHHQSLYASMLIAASQLRFLRYIGCGAFGKVWEGRLIVRAESTGGEDRLERVALKVRNVKSLTEDEFKREAALMQRYQHDNIVRFYGMSLDSPQHQCLVLELMEQGNLRDYLHRARPRLTPSQAEQFSRQEHSAARSTDRSSRQTETTTATTCSATITSENVEAGGVTTAVSGGMVELEAILTIADLMRIMRDIARGCHYLEEQHFVHRDIAARNCLVSLNHESGRIVKLCDFGLARDIYKNDYYRKRNEPKLPVRWMSPEAILEGLFTSKSDIWAFAVTCWEVMSLGADPFFGQVNLEVINLVLGGNVLSKPDNCPPKMYDLMLQCWSRFPEIRPNFAEVLKVMDNFVEASNDAASPFSGAFIYRVSLAGGASTNQQSQSTPTVGETDWRYNGGVTRNGNESDMNIIQSNSVSYVSNSGGGGGVHGGNSGALHKDQTPVSSTTYIRSSTNLQRHLSCPRPYLANSNGSQVYFNSRPSSQMMQVHYEGSLSRPQHQQQHPLRNHLRRQHSDRYQYHRDPVEVDSMGYERPAILMMGPYFNTQPHFQALYHQGAGNQHHQQQQSPRSPSNYAIPARPPLSRDSNYGIMHHSLYVGDPTESLQPSSANPRPLLSPPINRNMLQTSPFEFHNFNADPPHSAGE